MDTHGINEQALEDEAGINIGRSESQHSSAPVTRTYYLGLVNVQTIHQMAQFNRNVYASLTTASTHTFAAYHEHSTLNQVSINISVALIYP
jgi:hypothetical protein